MDHDMDHESKSQEEPADEAGSQLFEAILLILAEAGKASVKELCVLLKSSAFRDRSGSAPPTANAGLPAAPSPITEEERRRQVRETVEAAIRRLEVQGACRATGQGLAKWVRIASPLPPALQRRMAALEAAEAAAVNGALQVLGDGRPHPAHELGSALPDSAELSNVVTRKLLGERVLSRIGESPGVVSRWEYAEGASTRWFERRPATGTGANAQEVAAGPAAGATPEPAAEAPAVSAAAREDARPAEVPPSPHDANEVVIDAELAKLLPPHTAEERAQVGNQSSSRTASVATPWCGGRGATSVWTATRAGRSARPTTSPTRWSMSSCRTSTRRDDGSSKIRWAGGI